MALISPEFLQTQKYSALRDRLAFQHGGAIQPGAWDANDFKVIQRASSAGQAVDVNAGFAVVGASSGGNFGYYHVQNDASITNVAVAPSHATLPRVDSVYLVVNDSTNGGDANDTPAITVVSGTASSGATLDNRTGAPTPPTDALLLADILVPAASSSVVTANIRDRRQWARGAYSIVQYTGTDINVTSSSAVEISPTLNQRIECSGGPLQMRLYSRFAAPTNAGTAMVFPWLDGALIPSVGEIYAYDWNGIKNVFLDNSVDFSPTPGSHKLTWAARSNASQTISFMSGSGGIGINPPITAVVKEVARPTANNN